MANTHNKGKENVTGLWMDCIMNKSVACVWLRGREIQKLTQRQDEKEKKAFKEKEKYFLHLVVLVQISTMWLESAFRYKVCQECNFKSKNKPNTKYMETNNS